MTNKERYRKIFDMLSASGMEKLEVETMKRRTNTLQNWLNL